MLTQKVNKKKDQTLIALIIVIVLIVAVLLSKSYVFKDAGENIIDSIINQDAGTDIRDSKDLPKTFNTEIFKDPKYGSLKDNNIKIKKIEELKVGNDNPFAAEKK